MSSFKLNIGLVRDCPPLITLKAALETVGRPSDKDYGVLAVHDISDGRLEFGLFRTKEVKLQKVEKTDGSLSRPITYKDELYEAMIRLQPATVAEGGSETADESTEQVAQPTERIGVLEVYTGSAKAAGKVGEFLSILELADQNPTVEFIPQVIMGSVQKLLEWCKTVKVVSAKVVAYKDTNDDSLTGTYTVKFGKEVPAPNALSFIQDHADMLDSVKIKCRVEGMKKDMTIVLRGSAYFTITANEADETAAKNVGRRLAGIPTIHGR